MSNTARVTPYTDDRPAEIITEAIDDMISALREAAPPSELETAAITRYRNMARHGLLNAARVDARLAENDDLIQAARTLGFKSVRATPSPRAPVELVSPSGATLLIKAAGDSLQLVGAGRVDIGAGVRTDAIGAVVRQCTLERARRHLEKRSGKAVRSKVLANGEVELQAMDERDRGSPAGVTAIVAHDGRIELDISCADARCAQVLDGFAGAVGGAVRNKTIKPEYYAPALPGEPTRVTPKG